MTSQTTIISFVKVKPGTCRIFVSGHDMRCPECRDLVKDGTKHQCGEKK